MISVTRTLTARDESLCHRGGGERGNQAETTLRSLRAQIHRLTPHSCALIYTPEAFLNKFTVLFYKMAIANLSSMSFKVREPARARPGTA